MSGEEHVQKYDLSGGDTVEVHQPFGKQVYFAIADMEGNPYPEGGKIAKDNGRIEYMLMLEGEMNITINGETKTVKQGEFIQVNDGDTYSIVGKGRSLVFVKDEEGGKTEILPKE
jgi:quercetin dioxygenase-like cupin family protein